LINSGNRAPVSDAKLLTAVSKIEAGESAAALNLLRADDVGQTRAQKTSRLIGRST
jgi:hypothetical protein